MTYYRRRYGMGRRFFFTVMTHQWCKLLTSDEAEALSLPEKSE